MSSGIKLLIADRDTLLPRRLAEFLNDKGFSCELVNNGRQLKSLLSNWIPQFIFVDLLLPDLNAVDVLKFIQEDPILSKHNIQVLVTSGHNSVDNVRKCLTAGAVDYIVKPFRVEDILSRLVFHIQNKRQIVDVDKEDRSRLEGGDLFLNLMELVLREAASGRSHRSILYNLTKMVALSLKAVRCSVVECNREMMEGFVIASSDDPKVRDIKLDLNRYPEIIHVMNYGKVVAIENMELNPTLAKIKELVKTISFNALVVSPIYMRGELFGVLSARMDNKGKAFLDREIRFAQLVAHVAGLVLENVDYMPFDQKKPAA
ncbi:MAG TPA: response regulator [Bdellovibrionales bacterium]|nr:response regulator [Bdellovibrionales bacterium]